MSPQPAAPGSDPPSGSTITGAWLGTTATNGVTLAIGMCTGILAARLLLPEGRGALAALMFWPGLFWSIGLLSFGDAVAYRISKSDDRDQPTVTVTALCVALALAAVVGALTTVLLPRLLGAERQAFWQVGQLFALTYIPLLTVAKIMVAVELGRLRFGRYNLLRMLPPLVYLGGLIVLWATGSMGVSTAVAAFWLGTLVAVIVRTVVRAHDLLAWPSRAEGRRLLDLSLPFQGTNLAFLLGTHLDRLILMTFWDDAAIGLYVVASSMATLGGLTMSFQTVLLPHIAAEARPERQRALLARGLRYACLLLVVATLGLILLTPWLLPMLFGAGFAGAVPVALILLGAGLPLALRQIIVRSLRGFGEARPGTIAEVVGIVAFLACAWPLIRAFDLLGVGAALLIANLAALAYLAHYLRRRFSLAPQEWWGLDLRTSREVAALGLEQVRSLWERHVRARRLASGSGRTPTD